MLTMVLMVVFVCGRFGTKVVATGSLLDDYDEMLAKEGPPAIFTSIMKDAYSLIVRVAISPVNIQSAREWCHCVYIDTATGWPQYVLCTSPDCVAAICATFRVFFV